MPIRLMENFRAVFYAPYYATHALGFYNARASRSSCSPPTRRATPCPS